MVAQESARVEQSAAQLDHRRAVERVIAVMTERLNERLSLEELASVAFFSPYHFHRVFRQVTGVPPGRFFTALRMEVAKRLLLTSELSVTEICYTVGYLSLGTFTSQFTRLVGISPRRLRACARSNGWSCLATLEEPPVEPDALPAVVGRIECRDGEPGSLAAIGLFPGRLAEGRPAGCALVGAPGDYEIRSGRGGAFHVLAASLAPGGQWNDLMLDAEHTRIAATPTPIVVRPGRPVRIDLVLRPRRIVDPPVLLAPALLLQPAAERVTRELVPA